MANSNYILEVGHLNNHYGTGSSTLFSQKKSVSVLKDVSFHIRRGELFGLVGESGCGKSTLGRAIVGLTETEGDIWIDGEKITGKRRKEQKKNVQIVFQDPLSSLNPKKKIGWILEEPLRIHKIGTRREREQRVNRILELVGLDAGYRDRYPHELSGGQRQRISIGCALMLEPKLIIADEPVSALDVSVQSQILNLLKDLHDSLNVSFLFISHNLDVVYYLCDRVAVMYLGRIVELANVEDLYDFPLHPYTRTLLSAIPVIGQTSGPANRPFGEIGRSDNEADGCSFYPRCPDANDKCRRESPELVQLKGGSGEDRYVRCHLAGGSQLP